MAIEKHAEFVDSVDDLTLVENVPSLLQLPLRAGHFVQRQHGVIGRMIGIMAGRPIDDLAELAQGEDNRRSRSTSLWVMSQPCWAFAVGVQERTRVPAPGRIR